MSSDSDAQYDALSRSIVALARLRGGPRPVDLCMHKALLPGPEGSPGGKRAVETLLVSQITAMAPRRVLDIGCGFGSLLAALQADWQGQSLGINASAFPIDYGAAFWERHGPGNTAEMRQGAFGCNLEAEPFDAVIALESLGYARDLTATMSWLYNLLSPGGQVWVLDDWAADDLAADDEDRRALCVNWRRSHLYSGGQFAAAARACGLEVRERRSLTERVPARQRAPRRARRHLLQWLRRLGGRRAAGEIGAAFLGGWHLERLYHRGLTHYDLFILRRPRDA